jgi:hypothetical protein
MVEAKNSRRIGAVGSAAGGRSRSPCSRAHAEGTVALGVAMYTTASDISRVGNSGVANDDCDVAPFEMFRAQHTEFSWRRGSEESLVPLVYADYPTTFPPTVMTTSTTDLIPSNSLRLRRCADGVSAASMLDGAMTGPDSVTYRNHCYSGSGDRCVFSNVRSAILSAH